MRNYLKDFSFFKYYNFYMFEAKKKERTNLLMEVKRLCKEFGFTNGMLKGSPAEGSKPKS